MTGNAVECTDHGIFVPRSGPDALPALGDSSPAAPSSKPCPQCRTEMGGISVRGVRLDQCRSCRGVWFDRGEFEALAAEDDASSKREPRLRDVGIAEFLASFLG